MRKAARLQAAQTNFAAARGLKPRRSIYGQTVAERPDRTTPT